ncbi:MAG: hypothetical protein ACI91U_001997 [Candidatus Poriferisodalaceae bacterium]|jgi:hypothetical protein
MAGPAGSAIVCFALPQGVVLSNRFPYRRHEAA